MSLFADHVYQTGRSGENFTYFMVTDTAIKARHWREESASTHSNLSGGNNLYIKTGQDITLEPGDVYCTRHSNLKDVHLVFHLVKDDSLTSTDISSRSNMTMAWCMRRAEMVFKCVKGYLMEVCGVCGGSAVGGGVTNVPHYNINLVLPSGLADEVYQQISAMVPSIFHLVPSVSVAVQEM
ncbi:hypothetical protein DICVIV_12872 [Dictyocaulus viviparus]|uniref:Uncharacterized protein n=1 Tax=Dictyocaulus viviparus TaxID=29172 RepID=A0A0D8X981_DICVI|nr:hypothetical protein DICVIV_12872 [Dictyocaulus viviparus]